MCYTFVFRMSLCDISLNWLSNILHCAIDLSSISSCFSICFRNWSTQLQDVVMAAVIYVVWAMWSCRNKCRFANKFISARSSAGLIKVVVMNSENLFDGTMFSSVEEFSILKAFTLNVMLGQLLE